MHEAQCTQRACNAHLGMRAVHTTRTLLRLSCTMHAWVHALCALKHALCVQHMCSACNVHACAGAQAPQGSWVAPDVSTLRHTQLWERVHLGAFPRCPCIPMCTAMDMLPLARALLGIGCIHLRGMLLNVHFASTRRVLLGVFS